MVVSTLAALVAAAMFAITTNLQRAAASSVPSAGSGPLHLARRLVNDPRWLVGGLIGGGALALHALALARGSVMVVQSVMALGLVFALAEEARRERRRMRRHEAAGAALVVLGVAVVVGTSHTGRPGAFGVPVLAACLGVALAALVIVVRSRRRVGARWEARALAAAGGACFAVDAVFLQRVAALVVEGPGVVLHSPVAAVTALADLAGFMVTSMVGTVAIHRAYQVAPLRAVQPALAAAEPVTAFLVGVTVLHEGVRGGALGYAVLVGGLVALITGIFVGLPGAAVEAPVEAPVEVPAPAPVPTPRAVAGPRATPVGAVREPLPVGAARRSNRPAAARPVPHPLGGPRPARTARRGTVPVGAVPH